MMAQPTLDELYAKHGTQQAVYLDDYLAEHGARLARCGRCGRLMVMTGRRVYWEAEWLRCAECVAAAGEANRRA